MKAYLRKTWQLHALLLPTILFIAVFSYVPILGLVIAFQDYKPWLGFAGSPWAGLTHFEYMFTYPDSVQVIWNTFIISFLKIAAGFVVPFVFALLLNEVRKTAFKRTVQTFVYLPHFLSWVILGGILTDLLSVNGLLNRGLAALFGIDPIMFLGDGNWFRATIVISDIWKEFGFSTIVYLAALTGVNPSLYEASDIDGANRWQQTIHITIPSILPIAVVLATLSLGNILNAGFDQIFNLYSPLVYDKGDIIDTFVYRVGLQGSNYSFATAVGLFKSVVGFVLIVLTYGAANKAANYRIF
ncbi:ABC transporter permease [Paenibacillus sp. GCM10023250]|uniref:ABC transporter permease n=1 Tax=Paenibacillus sp. GCM10023250 TaxID=3252648 RepID=UPI003616C401